ncbi:MAG: DHA2 family efflux MFS transporter permease subunit [Deltaproteobacteria bacterium]|nr:DHA2 family efflux MFS transporter permease subunit [Deltaproteobacteria bacterium]
MEENPQIPAQPELTTRHKWLITSAVMMGTLMGGISGSIINVALPHMRGSLGASIEEIAWVATGYMLSSVIVMPIIALLSSRYGRKNFLIFSVFTFTISSMFCGIAWDLNSMVFFRIVQGIGGGALIPIAMAVLRETFPPREQAQAMSIFGLGVMLGPAFAPTLGGWITDNYSWRWCFYLNVPFGALTVFLIMRFLEDPPYLIREKGKVDIPGLFFLAVGLGSLQIMLERGQRENWLSSATIRYLAIAAFLGLVFFVWRELTTRKPAVNLRILKDLNYASGTALGSILNMGLMGGIFILPLFLQQLLQYPAYDSGFALLPRSIAMAMAMSVGGRLYNRIGPKPLVGAGLIVCFFSSYWLSRLALNVGYWDIFTAQFLQGIGFGFLFVSLSTASLSTISLPMMTAATGLHNVIRNMFGSIGIAMSATFLSRGETFYRTILMDKISLYRNVTSDRMRLLSAYFFMKGYDQTTADNKALKIIQAIVMRHSMMLSFNHAFFLIALLFILAVPFVFALKDDRLKDFGKA